MRAGSFGRIITFYSYKGGTGRSMALANIAYLLAQNRGNRVLMLDWDLEAPGLHRYVRDLVRQRFPGDHQSNGFDAWPGLVDLFREIEGLTAGAGASIADLPIDRLIVKTDVPGLDLIKAGRFDIAYSEAMNTLNWQRMYMQAPGIFAAFGNQLSERYDYVLIDARTGLTDTGGICTSILPDTLVIVFTPNRQSLLGGVDIARSAAQYRKDSDDLRPLRVLPLPSRMEPAEPSLRERWRLGDVDTDVPGYQPLFESLFCSLYGLPSCDLSLYFDEVQIQHLPRFAYGEEIAARVEPADRLSLTRSFEHFEKWIVAGELPWEKLPTKTGEPRSTPAVDNAWLHEKRTAAQSGLKKIDARGYMEASFFLAPALEAVPSPRLFQAAQAAQVPGTGWPIGAVVGVENASRPQPTRDGLATEIIDKMTNSYDYWSLRYDGSFYFARNLEEDADYLLIDDRIARAAELLLYCKRLYGFLATERNARVLISVSFGGLAGRALGSRLPEEQDKFEQLIGNCSQDTAAAETVTDLTSIYRNLDSLVEVLTTPLFATFDFYQLPPTARSRMIAKNLADWGMV